MKPLILNILMKHKVHDSRSRLIVTIARLKYTVNISLICRHRHHRINCISLHSDSSIFRNQCLFSGYYSTNDVPGISKESFVFEALRIDVKIMKFLFYKPLPFLFVIVKSCRATIPSLTKKSEIMQLW